MSTVEDEVFHADGQTDMKLTVAFRNFGNASNKMRTRHKCITARSNKLFSGHAVGGTDGRGTALQAGRSRIRFPIVSLEFFIDIILPATLQMY
jgi:hypothetical protein